MKNGARYYRRNAREDRAALAHLKREVTVGNRHIAQSILALANSYSMLGRPEEAPPELRALIEYHFARPPRCPACYKPMHLEGVNEDKEYPKLRHVIFACSCGRKSDQLLAAGALASSIWTR